MAPLPSDLTVVLRVTDAAWGARAAAVAMMIAEAGAQPERLEVRRYGTAGERDAERISSGYEALTGIQTTWLLSIDADSYVHGDVYALARGCAELGLSAALRLSPLQAGPRNDWREDLYGALFEGAGLRYRRLGTTCAFLLRRDVVEEALPTVRAWRMWVDAWAAERGVKLSRSYHNAQVAFALALAEAHVKDEQTWWWTREQLSFAGEPPGIIHHEAFASYRFPYERKESP